MKKDFTNKFLFLTLLLTVAAVTISAAQTAITDGGFVFTGSTTGDINWTNQTGNLLIFAKPSAAITPGTPTATYASYGTENTDVSAGTVHYENDPAAVLVFKGTAGGPVHLTGLTAGIDYYFLIYNTTGTATYSAADSFSSAEAVTGGSFTATCTDAGTVNWTNPSTVGNIVVFAKKGSTPITQGTPTALAATYTANVNATSGTALSTDPLAHCVFNSATGSAVSINTLTPPGGAYQFLIYNVVGHSYSAGVAFSGNTLAAVPDVTGLSATPLSGSVTLSWTNPTNCFSKVIVVASETSTPPFSAPAAGSYTASPIFGTAAALYPSTTDQYVVFQGTLATTVVTGLTNCHTYNFEVFVYNGTTWSNGTSTSAVPVGGAPAVTGYLPAQNATNVPTNTSLQLTFNGPPLLKSIAPAVDTKVTITDITSTPTVLATIDASSTSNFTISGNTVTITFSPELAVGKKYEVTVGASVFTVCGSPFTGVLPTVWDFTASPGATISPVSAGVCVGSYSPLGDIVIQETAVNNFQGTQNGTMTLVLALDAGYAFQPGAGPTLQFTAGNDIASVGTPVISFSKSTFSFTFKNVANVQSNIDKITIHGLSVTSDGSNASPGSITLDASSSFNFQGILPGAILGTVTNGPTATAPTNPVYTTNPAAYCANTNISAEKITVDVTSGNVIKWYPDNTLTTPTYATTSASTTSSANLASDLHINSATPGTYNFFVTQTSTGCQSPALQVTVRINPLPVIDAGSLGTQCSGVPVNLGGSPTVKIGTTYPYTYTWTETTGSYSPARAAALSGPNPTTDTLRNIGSTNVNYNFVVTVKDANNCSGSANNIFNVSPQSTPILTLPTTRFFNTSTTPQILGANYKTTSFTGIGVVQTNSSTYSFDPGEAYDDTKILPQTYNIYFNGQDTVTGCPINNFLIATMTLTNTTFLNVAPQYCSDEFPNPGVGSVQLTIAGPSLTNITNSVNAWNNTNRKNHGVPSWYLTSYQQNDLVSYGGEIYRASTNVSLTAPPSAPWVAGAFEIQFTGLVRDQNEYVLGGFVSTPTIVQSGSATDGSNFYMNTKPNYVNCLNCTSIKPSPYALFIKFSDARYYFPAYSFFGFYYPGDYVLYGGRIYECKQFNYFGIGFPTNPFYWKDVTATTFESTSLGIFWDYPNSTAGLSENPQSVTINQNPQVGFVGFSTTQPAKNNNVCQTDITGTQNNVVPLNSLFNSTLGNRGTFQISFDGGTTWSSDGSSGNAIVNSSANSGIANFNSLDAWNQIAPTILTPAFAYSPAKSYNPGDNVSSGGLFYTAKSGSIGQSLSDTVYWRANTLKLDVRLYYQTGAVGSTHGGAPVGGVGDNCFSVSSVPVYIHQKPAIQNLGTSPTTFCSTDNSSVAFVPSPLAGMKVSGNGVTQATTGAIPIFIASSAYSLNKSTLAQTISITGVLTDKFGCLNSYIDNSYIVNPPPYAVYTIYKNDDVTAITKIDASQPTQTTSLSFCYTDDPVIFQRNNQSPPAPPVPPNTWWILEYDDNGKDSIVSSSFTFSPVTYYGKASTSHGVQPNTPATFRITYFSVDAINCKTKTQTLTATVSPVLDVSIQGIKNNDLFCSNAGVIPLTLTNYNPSNSTLKINGVPEPIGTPTKVNGYDYLASLNLGDVKFVYNVTSGTSGTSCQNPDTVTIHVVPSPIASFLAYPHCVGDTVTYDGEDVSKATVPPGTTRSFLWTFSDTDTTTSNVQKPVHIWKTQGNTFFVDLKLSYSPDPVYGKVCTANDALTVPLNIHQTQVIGPIPNVDFSFSNVCASDATNFVVNTTSPYGQGVTKYMWDFGDGYSTKLGFSLASIASVPNTSGTYAQPVHSYGGISKNNVTLLGRTDSLNGFCPNTKTRTVSILKYDKSISPTNPYEMGVTTGNWVVEDKNGASNWHFSTVSPRISPPENAWNNFPYKASDDSYMNSPCFDMSAYHLPAVGLQYFSDVRQGQDGAVLQYSTTIVGGIQQWVTLGSINSGQNWYNNTQPVSGKPGEDIFNPSGYGWTAKGDSSWVVSKHSLDVITTKSLSERQKVRFRIAFGSDGGTPLDSGGFAFNNVSIVERNRFSLIENFTNAFAPASKNDTIFDKFTPTGNGQVAKLEYHTSIPKPDAINLMNSADQDARAGFYGLTNTTSIIPGGFLDGISGGNFQPRNSTDSSWISDAYNLRSLTPSPITLTLDDSKPGSMTVAATAITDIPTGSLRLFVVAMENPKKFYTRKIFPSAAGYPIQTPFAKNTSVSLTVPWTLYSNQVKNPADVGLVAFVQNIDSKDVLQAYYNPSPAHPLTTVTGLKELSNVTSVYPIPANDEFIIELPDLAQQGFTFRLLNGVGQSVVENKFNIGEKRKVVNTQSLADGVYILQLGDNGRILNRKVMIIHK